MSARNILVINCGSSSIKFALINEAQPHFTLSGLAERLGSPQAELHWKNAEGKRSELIQGADHRQALSRILPLAEKAAGGQLHGIGHRVVHGGEHFTSACLIDQAALQAIAATAALAPLHNPANLQGIEAALKLFPQLPQVAVFDTAFHQSMPEHAYRYAVPEALYRQHGVRRYGFHGTSHRFVSQRASELCQLDYQASCWLTAHLGNGCSTAAVVNGHSQDTSMGLTPLEGLVMGTRCGDIDASIPGFMAEQAQMSLGDIDNALNKKSGLLGVSGVSSDMRDVENAAAAGNARAQMALDMLLHRALKYIGAYAIELGRVDAIVFTGGIGENGHEFRAAVVERLGALGVKLDPAANKVRGKEAVISTADSPIKVLVVPTNEELVIARDTKEIVGR